MYSGQCISDHPWLLLPRKDPFKDSLLYSGFHQASRHQTQQVDVSILKKLRTKIDDNTPLNEQSRKKRKRIYFDVLWFCIFFSFKFLSYSFSVWRLHKASLLKIIWTHCCCVALLYIFWYFFSSFLHRQISKNFIYSTFSLSRSCWSFSRRRKRTRIKEFFFFISFGVRCFERWCRCCFSDSVEKFIIQRNFECQTNYFIAASITRFRRDLNIIFT